MTRVTNDSQKHSEHPAGLRAGTQETLQENRARFASHGLFCLEKETFSFRERQSQPSLNSHRALGMT